MPPSRNAPCPCGSGRKYKKCCEPQRTALSIVPRAADDDDDDGADPPDEAPATPAAAPRRKAKRPPVLRKDDDVLEVMMETAELREAWDRLDFYSQRDVRARLRERLGIE